MDPRPELTRLPPRLARLPLDSRGYPVPWFVHWIDGAPEFRLMDPAKWMRAVRERRCWVCGDTLGQYLTFVVGPMCGLNRTTSEPPCHRDCAEWSALNCPFLSRPHMKRREDELIEACKGNNAGDMIARNPGVTLLWTTKSYQVFDDGRGRPLIAMGPSLRVAWVAEGRNARLSEVVASVESGLPALRSACLREATPLRQLDARKELDRRLDELRELYPPEEEQLCAEVVQ